jgi:heme-degrading monooxygenase HmoA
MAKFARVTFAEADPARVEDGIANIKEVVIPRARELPGFQGGYWLADREAGKVIGVTMFDSEESLRETDEAAAQIRQQAGSAIGVTFSAIESYEVIAEV